MVDRTLIALGGALVLCGILGLLSKILRRRRRAEARPGASEAKVEG